MCAISFSLHLITEPKRNLLEAVEAALAAGADWVQLRDKNASAAATFQQASALRELTRRYGAKLSINDRLDVALAVDADGVHLAGQSLPVAEAVGVAAGRLRVGRSVHGLQEAIACAQAGADYLTFGHIFPSNSKPGEPPRGVAQLQEIVRAVDVPVMAIGGVTPANLELTLATGCAGVAVISAILSAADPRAAAAQLVAGLRASTCQPRFALESQEEPYATHR
ncbi:MAG TPA: thiamine phosphate synthase [Chloroflexota bacterium]|nr:thiamine phosphate synthase [Chloroflexota bacterium]